MMEATGRGSLTMIIRVVYRYMGKHCLFIDHFVNASLVIDVWFIDFILRLFDGRVILWKSPVNILPLPSFVWML